MADAKQSESTDWSSGRIRIEFAGGIAISEFSNRLRDIDQIYRRLNALLLDSKPYRLHLREIGSERRHSIVLNPHEVYGIDRRDDDLFEHAVVSALNRSTPLVLGSARFSSPGFVEMLGNWNPLKVIADFVTAWRRENTLREQHRSEAEIEKMKVQAEITKALIEHGDKLIVENYNTIFMNQFVDYTLHDTMEMLEALASEIRIGDVHAREDEHDEMPNKRMESND